MQKCNFGFSWHFKGSLLLESEIAKKSTDLQKYGAEVDAFKRDAEKKWLYRDSALSTSKIKEGTLASMKAEVESLKSPSTP